LRSPTSHIVSFADSSCSKENPVGCGAGYAVFSKKEAHLFAYPKEMRNFVAQEKKFRTKRKDY